MNIKEKKEYIIKNVSNILELKDESILIECPICGAEDDILISKVIIRLRNKGDNHKEDNYELTCSNRKCSNSQSQKRQSTRDKIEQTNLQRYGYKTFLETSENRKISDNASIKKYGSLSNRSKIGWDNYYKKTGYKHNMNNPNVVKLNQLHRVETIKNMSKERKKLWADRRRKTHKKNGTIMFGDSIKSGYNRSKQQINFYEDLKCIYNIIEEEKIVWLNDKNHAKIDFYLPDKNIAIEYKGDYWHANPNIYNDGDMIHTKGGIIPVNIIWENDRIRETKIINILNCKLISVWEHDYINDKKNTLNKLEEIING